MPRGPARTAASTSQAGSSSRASPPPRLARSGGHAGHNNRTGLAQILGRVQASDRILSRNAGPSRAVWANPVRISVAALGNERGQTVPEGAPALYLLAPDAKHAHLGFGPTIVLELEAPNLFVNLCEVDEQRYNATPATM
jgi:hypothetical protein